MDVLPRMKYSMISVTTTFFSELFGLFVLVLQSKSCQQTRITYRSESEQFVLVTSFEVALFGMLQLRTFVAKENPKIFKAWNHYHCVHEQNLQNLGLNKSLQQIPLNTHLL